MSFLENVGYSLLGPLGWGLRAVKAAKENPEATAKVAKTAVKVAEYAAPIPVAAAKFAAKKPEIVAGGLFGLPGYLIAKNLA